MGPECFPGSTCMWGIYRSIQRLTYTWLYAIYPHCIDREDRAADMTDCGYSSTSAMRTTQVQYMSRSVRVPESKSVR